MSIEQKSELVKHYIINTSNRLNAKYNNILTQDKINQAIYMFTNSEKKYEEIIEEINELVTSIEENYIKLQKEFDNYDRNSRTFEQIKNTLVKVQQLLDSYGLKVFISGGTVPYLLLNQDSNRLHDDIDTVCRLEDIERLREVFKQAGLYQKEWDSKNYASDGKDYGFEMKIDGVPFGIYPFSYEDGILTQYSYDPYNMQCKIKTLQLEQLSDYIVSYSGADGKIYTTMSLEFIKLTKDFAKREKDIVDSLKIIETGMLRPEVMQRIKMFSEIQNIEASKLGSKTNLMNPQLENYMSD